MTKRTSPVVGLLLKNITEEYGNIIPGAKLVVEDTYVSFLEQGGARVIPIDYTSSFEDINKILAQVDGVLFPGGGTNLTLMKNGIFDLSQFTKAGQFILNKSIELKNQNSFPIPIWGTCLGFELILMAMANDPNFLQNCSHCDHYPASLDYFIDPYYTQLFGKMSPIDVLKLSSIPLTPNNHEHGITRELFNDKTYNYLHQYIKLTSESNASDSLSNFIASVEGIDIPIYATQYHPEKWVYVNNVEFNHYIDTAVLMQEHSEIFLSKCRERMEALNRDDTDFDIYKESIYTLNSFYYSPRGVNLYYTLSSTD